MEAQPVCVEHVLGPSANPLLRLDFVSVYLFLVLLLVVWMQDTSGRQVDAGYSHFSLIYVQDSITILDLQISM